MNSSDKSPFSSVFVRDDSPLFVRSMLGLAAWVMGAERVRVDDMRGDVRIERQGHGAR